MHSNLAESRTATLKPKQVLIVDDDETVFSILEIALTSAGFECLFANNGNDAIKLYAEHEIDAVLLDVMMPDIDGFETCQSMRTIKTDLAIPIIMLTGLDDEISISQAFDAGATDFIMKPFQLSIINHRIRYAIRNHENYIRLKKREQMLVFVQEAANLGYWELELDFSDLRLSEKAMAIFELTPDEQILFEDFVNKIDSGDRDAVKKAMNNAKTNGDAFSIEFQIHCKTGEVKYLVQTGVLTQIEDKKVLTGSLQDITTRKKEQDLLFYRMNYDALTGLANSEYLKRQIAQSMTVADNDYNLFAFIIVAIDRFDRFVESLGHAQGDQIIRYIANKLKRHNYYDYFVARFSNHKFAICKGSLSSFNEAGEFIKQLLADVSIPFKIDEHEILATFSAGVSIYPLSANNESELIGQADIALSRATESGGRQFRYYAKDMDENLLHYFELEKQMRQGLDENQFVVFYQPQICANSEMIVGVEALVRWQHPERGLVSPIDFIPLAEDTGLIVPMGAQVLRLAVHQIAQWRKQGLAELTVSVNLSVKQFIHDDVIVLIEQVLYESGLPATCLDIEVTESVAMQDMGQTQAILEQIRALGVKLAIDDFGTGYSSMAALKNLPFNRLKIDRAFVKDIGLNSEADSGEFASAINAMAHNLKMEVVAEGVETKAQLEFLKAEGVDLIQGYYFSPPLPAEKLE
ncbi:MAG: EAL domain-containing protein, partial [Gammaproteobacteria bacterium]|nr:EAL domain-containing protein [Gammaproteobacteria bacterium]